MPVSRNTSAVVPDEPASPELARPVRAARPKRARRAPESEPVPSEGHPLEVTPDTATALKLFIVLARAQGAVSAHAAADVARHGLTLTEFAILEALYHRGAMLLGEVQRRILVSSGGITFLVDRLVAKGLVERQQCPTDRRARYATLTDAGTALLASIFPEHADTLVRALGALDSEEQATVTRLLKRLGHAAAAAELPSTNGTRAN